MKPLAVGAEKTFEEEEEEPEEEEEVVRPFLIYSID
jgi:hypothetical protein